MRSPPRKFYALATFAIDQRCPEGIAQAGQQAFLFALQAALNLKLLVLQLLLFAFQHLLQSALFLLKPLLNFLLALLQRGDDRAGTLFGSHGLVLPSAGQAGDNGVDRFGLAR